MVFQAHCRQPLDTGKRIIFCSAMTVLFRALLFFPACLLSLAGPKLCGATTPRYATIDESIARGDLDDVRVHVANEPAIAGRAGARGLPLHQAILRNKTEIALFLLESGASVDAADRTQRTPLHLAVERGNVALVRALLERHAAPNERDAVGWTPLHHAAARDKLDIAGALLAGGADPKTLSERGGTALHEAAASAGAAMIRLLLEAGVDPAVVSKNGVTALEVAREFKNEPAIAELAVPARHVP
jgi:ankyrin repeat protein